MSEVCQKCGVIGQDRRTLFMACFYEMRELGIPLDIVAFRGPIEKVIDIVDRPWGKQEQWSDTRDENKDARDDIFPMFTLRVCKGCRAEWMQSIQTWYRAPPGQTSKWNNDERCDVQHVATLVAQLHELTIQTKALEQRISDSLHVTQKELDERTQKTSL